MHECVEEVRVGKVIGALVQLEGTVIEASHKYASPSVIRTVHTRRPFYFVDEADGRNIIATSADSSQREIARLMALELDGAFNDVAEIPISPFPDIEGDEP